jgi:hypothetical protein
MSEVHIPFTEMDDEAAASSGGARMRGLRTGFVQTAVLIRVKRLGVRSDGGDHRLAGVQSLFPMMGTAQAAECSKQIVIEILSLLTLFQSKSQFTFDYQTGRPPKCGSMLSETSTALKWPQFFAPVGYHVPPLFFRWC